LLREEESRTGKEALELVITKEEIIRKEGAFVER
jgi:hypothetical protein